MKITITCAPHFLAAGLTLLASAASLSAGADVVTDWNQNMFTAVYTAKLGPLATSHLSALVQSAVFDAVNGVRRHYMPIYVPPTAPPGTSAEAAAAQAAHDILRRPYLVGHILAPGDASLNRRAEGLCRFVRQTSQRDRQLRIQRGLLCRKNRELRLVGRAGAAIDPAHQLDFIEIPAVFGAGQGWRRLWPELIMRVDGPSCRVSHLGVGIGGAMMGSTRLQRHFLAD